MQVHLLPIEASTVVSEVIGRSVDYVDVSPDQFLVGMVGAGFRSSLPTPSSPSTERSVPVTSRP